ncbi:MAG: hypothetical protein JAZ15_21695 [Candidatus Thiodiazotropha endolucinida]|nr:hypothetical protein [Candidatus Thiodiazotropha taylori]MCW4315631.1 hypothetical protein [Candidatus Thiodiazotropha taylori]
MTQHQFDLNEIERLFEEGDIDAVTKLLPSLVKRNIPAAIRIRASISYDEIDSEEFDKLFTEGMFRAAELGDKKARYQVGVFYDIGLYGIEQDKKKASKIFKELADEGDSHCMWIHACELLWGLGSYPKSVQKGLIYLDLAIKKGSAEACITKAKLFKEQEFGFAFNENEVNRLRKLAKEYDETVFDPYA